MHMWYALILQRCAAPGIASGAAKGEELSATRVNRDRTGLWGEGSLDFALESIERGTLIKYTFCI